MKKISSDGTFFLKKIAPIIAVGIPGLMLALSVASHHADAKSVLFPIAIATFMLVVMRLVSSDLADAVYDCGDALLIKRGDEEERIPFANIMNVSITSTRNPPRITLRLVHAGKFGDHVVFSPSLQLQFNPFTAVDALAEDLMVRVDRARRAPAQVAARS